MDGSNLANNTTPTQKDASLGSIADLFVHFTIGMPASKDLGKTHQLEKKKPKVNPRLPQAAKRRLVSSDTTKPDTLTPLPNAKPNVTNITDPTRPEWLPNDPSWTNGFIQTLSSLERLTCLAIKRCTDKSIAQALIDQSNNSSFLPALQSLSFGDSHRFATLCLGRSIRSYGFTFRIKKSQDYDRLKGLLTNITSPREPLRELQITIMMLTMEAGSKVLETVGKCAPSLHRLSVLFLSRSPSYVRFDSRKVAHAISPLNQLKSLELFNALKFARGRTSQHATVIALMEPNGSCPNLQLANFDGTVWARTLPTVCSYAAQDESVNSLQGNDPSLSDFSWRLHSVR
ncbi:hypothetical protein FRC12_014585 [Ceratobasidium sp. 428]|nr:hypothetical protein FRC12_014585 [Ceratobasidium sp. 428]